MSTAKRLSWRASMMPHCAPRFGETVLDLEDPCRFPPILTDLELYLLGEGTQQRLYDKLRVHPMTIDGVAGVASSCSRPMRGGSVRQRFQFLECAAASDARARGRLSGIVRTPRHIGRSL